MEGSSPPYSQPKRLLSDHMDPDDRSGNHHQQHHHHHLVTPTLKDETYSHTATTR
jgi:hypothetical protein